jgi:multicomponent Na+:H+ antiporter subunit C
VEASLAVLVAAVVGAGLYLVLQRNLLRFVFGLILLSGGVNVLIFIAGRLTRGSPPIVPAGGTTPTGDVANALPQALILTAIVIGFGLTVFALVLLLRAYERLGTVHGDEFALRLAEPEPPPHPAEGAPAPQLAEGGAPS